ncbi:MAG: DUF5916 domain-containing protein [Candidatus Moduliflexus flocculans]|nr:DUF5916 domain-containing protein [Candidatus Moduliflexus flocculans]
MGLTFKPYGLLSPSKDHVAGTPADWRWDGGFDLYKSFTPNLVGAFSYNTDFAETEVDERRVNLTRFSLYFPEKRTFFLEGSEIFNFGTVTPSDGSGFAPFFSRRIGLFDGEQVPIAFGAKVFGKIGDTNLQVLDVRTSAHDDLGLPAENFLVARVSQNVLAESQVGADLHHRQPDRSPELPGRVRRRLSDLALPAATRTSWPAAGSSTTGTTRTEGRHEGFGFKIDYPNDLWDVAVSYNSYGDALDPGVGYLPRPERPASSALSVNYHAPARRRGSSGRLVRQFFFELRPSFTWDLAGRLETPAPVHGPLNLQTESGEQFEFNIVSNFDRLTEGWEVGDGVVLPAGAYAFTNYAFQFETAGHRAWGGRVEWQTSARSIRATSTTSKPGSGSSSRATPTFDLDANFVRGRLPERDLQGERLPAQGRPLPLAAARPDELRPVRRRLERARPQHALPLGDHAGQRRLPRLLEELGAALGPGVAVLSSRGTGNLQDHPQHPSSSRLAG